MILSLQTRLSDLITSIGTDYKAIRDRVVALESAPSGDVVQSDLDDLKAEILGAGVPAALDTLDELAAALADDANYAASVTTALAGKQSAASIGNADADLVAIYVAAKA